MMKRIICIIIIISQLLILNVNYSYSLENHQILIDNFKGGETVTYEMILLRGITIGNTTNISVSVNGGDAVSWPVHPTKNTFKALAHLKAGINTIAITASNNTDKNLVVDYTPKTEGPAVRFTYAISSDSDGSFARTVEGVDNSLEHAKKRITLDALIMQGTWAELMNDRGYGRQTFRIEFPDETGIAVFVKRLDKTTKELMNYNSINNETGNSPYTYGDFYSYIKSEISTNPGFIKNFVITGMSDFKIVDGKQVSYCSTALGGGDLALTGGDSLYSMPEDLQGVSNVLYNTKQGILPDTNPLWKIYGTSYVAGMHELGHSFNLNHIDGSKVFDWNTKQLKSDQSGIMSLGFYQGNRILAMRDGSGEDFNEDNSVCWNWGYITGTQKIQNDCSILSSELWISDSTDFKLEAEANGNILKGQATIIEQNNCSGCRKVGNIYEGIQFNNIFMPEDSYYKMFVYYNSSKSNNVVIDAGLNYKGQINYEAENGTLIGGAQVASSPNSSSRNSVRMIGYNGTDAINVSQEKSGIYDMSIYYISGDNRSFFISVNNGLALEVSNLNSGGWDKVAVKKVKIALKSGENTIKFYNNLNYAPDLDKISFASPNIAINFPASSDATDISRVAVDNIHFGAGFNSINFMNSEQKDFSSMDIDKIELVKLLYTPTPKPIPSPTLVKGKDTRITSSKYKVNNSKATISIGQSPISMSVFRTKILVTKGATYQILKVDGKTILSSGYVKPSMKIKVIAQDGKTYRVYTIIK